jgi:hypothetical protein
MSSRILDICSNQRFQLLATGLLSAAAAASLLLGYQALEREERLSELKSSIPSLTQDDDAQRVRVYSSFHYY